MTMGKIEELLERAEIAVKAFKYQELEIYTLQAIEFLSLKALNVSNTTDSERIFLLLARANRLLAVSLLKRGRALDARSYAMEALALTIKANDKNEEAKILTNIGVMYVSLSDFQLALEYYSKALTIHEELDNKQWIAIITGNIGIAYRGLADYPRALEYQFKALAEHEKLGMEADVARVTSNIGNIYENLADYSKALEYQFKALVIHEKLNNKAGVALVMGNIGTVYEMLADYPRALEYWFKALAEHNQLGNLANSAIMWNCIGNVYLALADCPNAFRFFFLALAEFEKLGLQLEVSRVTYLIGNAFFAVSDFQNALKNYFHALSILEKLGNKAEIVCVIINLGSLYSDKLFQGYDALKAEEYLLKAIAINEELGIKQNLYESHQIIANLYEQESEYAKALYHYKEYHKLYTAVQNEEVKKQAEKFGWERKIVELEKDKEIEKIKMEAENLLMEQTIKSQKVKIEVQTREVESMIHELVKKNNYLHLIKCEIEKVLPFTKNEGISIIEQVRDRINRNITSLESISELEKQWADVHADFMKQLKQEVPALTDMELKIAALLKMNLTSSNISSILFLSKRTVEFHRLNLRKKMRIHSDDDLHLILNTLAEQSMSRFQPN